MNERNVCIGDVISVGSEVVIQVSLPRQPCFKLNHRFSLKNFAPETYQSSRTGWYYRVLQEGTVRVGDELKLVERKWPRWTIERIQEYLHRDKDNLEMNELLSNVDALGDESRGQFKNRVAKANKKAKPKEEETWRDFKITERKMVTPRITSFVLEAVSPIDELETTGYGAQAKLKLPNGLIRSYSIVSGDDGGYDTANNRFELGIALEENSRGGSRYFHETAKLDDIIQVGKITTDVNLVSSASSHVFICGGIGITAFAAILAGIKDINWNHQVYYGVRSFGDIPFRERLEKLGDNVIIYDKSKGERMDIDHIVKSMPWNSHLYVCGPNRMMVAAKAAVEAHKIAPNEVHYEAFAADISGDPFEAEVVNKGKKVLKIKEEDTLLEALRREFGDFPSSCEVGNCATCKVTLVGGRVDHRGTALTPEEKQTSMLSCVSRGIGRIQVEV